MLSILSGKEFQEDGAATANARLASAIEWRQGNVTNQLLNHVKATWLDLSAGVPCLLFDVITEQINDDDDDDDDDVIGSVAVLCRP